MWDGAFAPLNQQYRTWDNAPGGTVVERFKDAFSGVEYVLVEFEKSPGVRYKYLAPTS